MTRTDDQHAAVSPASRLPPVVRRLGWVSFWLDVGSEMSYPLVPLFLASMLQAPGIALGLIEGVAEGSLAIVTALAGRHSDRVRRRVPFIRLGYGVAALAKPMLALAYSWPVVLVLRSLDRVGKGLRTAPRDALITDATEAEQRGAAFGFHRAMDTAGALVGVLLALALISWLPGQYRTLFALTAIPAVVAVALTLLVREAAPTATEPPNARGGVRNLGASFWRVAAVLWLFALANSSDAFLLLRAKDLGFSDTQVVWGYALMTLTYAGSAYPAGRLSDRFGRASVIAVGWAIYALIYGVFAWLSAPAVWLGFAVYGAYLGLTQGVATAWVADQAPRELRGTAQGVYRFGLGLALLASSTLAGWLWDAVAPSAPFIAGSLGAVLALMLLPFAARKAAQ